MILCSMAARKKSTPAPRKKAAMTATARKNRSADARPEQTRLWLMYPSRLIQRPVIWELGQKFSVISNLRQVSVTDEIGIVCLELGGKRSEIKKAVKWLEKIGISVEPVEINVIES